MRTHPSFMLSSSTTLMIQVRYLVHPLCGVHLEFLDKVRLPIIEVLPLGWSYWVIFIHTFDFLFIKVNFILVDFQITFCYYFIIICQCQFGETHFIVLSSHSYYTSIKFLFDPFLSTILHMYFPRILECLSA